MKIVTTILLTLMITAGFAQNNKSPKVQYYKNKGKTHFCGEISLETLQKDSLSKKWFAKYYKEFKLSDKKHKWTKNLKNVEVEIFFGTWCGMSKANIPKFVKMWEELGLDKNQLKFVALYNSGLGKYKQSPEREEKGKEIYRVPTFIIKEKGKEISRIVETPINDFETDLKQIAMGCPSTPNYRAAYDLAKLLRVKTPKELKSNYDYMNAVYRKTKNTGELNSLGYVYMDTGETEKALLAFYYNTQFYKDKANVYDSYAEALEKAGKYKEALQNYKKVLLLDKDNKNAKKKVKELSDKEGVQSSKIDNKKSKKDLNK